MARTPRKTSAGSGAAARVAEELLHHADSSVRWRARVFGFGEDRGSRRIRSLEEEVRESPRVRALLSERSDLGRLDTARRVYYKWQGLHWVLASLAELGYPRGDETLAAVRDRVLDLWLRPTYYLEYEPKGGRFLANGGVPVLEGRARRCASQQGSALLALTRLGLGDERSKDLVRLLRRWQWPDGGWNCDRHPEAASSSFMETLLPMRGLAVFGAETGSGEAVEAAHRAAEVFLSRRLLWRKRDGAPIRREFFRLHYPLYWHYDLLGGLKGLAEAGRIRDPRCAKALEELLGKQLPDGGWPAEARYYGGVATTLTPNRDYVDWGGVSVTRMNPWVTVDALYVLRMAGRIAL